MRQGERLSPFLFTLYINDLEQHLSVPGAGVSIGFIKRLLLLYADDVGIFAESSEMLQIDKLCKYCEKWKLRLRGNRKLSYFVRGTEGVQYLQTRIDWKTG